MTDRDGRPQGLTIDGLARMLQDGRITRRGFLAGAAGLMGSMAAAEGVLARVAGAQATSKNTLVIGQSSDISKFDPHLSTTVNDIAVTFNLFDNLSQPASGRQALSFAGHRVEAGEPDHLAVQAAAGRQVPQRRPADFCGRQVQLGADVRSEGQDQRDVGAEHDRARGHAGSAHGDASSPRSQTRSWPRGRPSTPGRSCPRATSRRSERTSSTPSRSAAVR